MTLRLLDTFSGIGGFSLAARWLGGFETVQFVERDPFCQRILRKHWPTVPIHDDICTFNPEPGSADVVVGGFPCQDISQAGKGAGLAGERSGLFYELLRVVRVVGPRYVVLENVAAILGRGLDEVLGALAEAGYDAEWACIPASAVGACHQRDRWWCVAYPSGTDGARRAEGAGRGISGEADAGGCGIPAICGIADTVANTQSSRWGARPGQGTGPAGHKGQGAGNGAAGSTANAYHQRQQEQHLAAIAGGEGWPRWGDAPRRLNPDWRAYVSEPVLHRGDDGLSNRVDRLRALGNAVVPQVAAIPLARVLHLAQLNSHAHPEAGPSASQRGLKLR
jgi:DNA (cytosine-5)-methyltransferase 1